MLSSAIVEGDVEQARHLAEQIAADPGLDPVMALEQGFIPGIREVGRLWQEGEYFLPELVQGAEAMKAAMAALTPRLARSGGHKARGKVVLGTVAGDLHDIGKSLVGALLVAHGFEVEDLGVDVPVCAFIDRAREGRADIVAASALLTTTMVTQRALVEAVAEARLDCAVLIGGAPTSARWAREVGAHYAESAPEAVEVACRLVQSR